MIICVLNVKSEDLWQYLVIDVRDVHNAKHAVVEVVLHDSAHNVKCNVRSAMEVKNQGAS
jgi:hypothetical protein